MRLQSKSRATSNRLPWWKTADFHAVFAVSEKHTEYLPSWNFCSQRSLLQNLNSFSLSVVYYNTSNNISVEIDQTHDFFNETMMSHENSTPKDAELIGIVRRASERVSTVWFPHLFPLKIWFGGVGKHGITCLAYEKNLFNLARTVSEIEVPKRITCSQR